MTAASTGPAVRQPIVVTKPLELARRARRIPGRQVWFDSATVVQIVGRPGAVGQFGPALAVDVAGWGGPLTELGPVAQLSVLLDGSGVDLRHVEAVVAEGSGGRLALLGVDAAAGGVEGRHVR